MTTEERGAILSEKLEEIGSLCLLRDGDVVVLQVPNDYSYVDELMGRLEHWRAEQAVSLRFIILPEIVTLSVLRREDAEADRLARAEVTR